MPSTPAASAPCAADPATLAANGHSAAAAAAPKHAAAHVWSPLVPAPQLSALAGRAVLLKLESVQPSGSFKVRGHAHLCGEAYARGVRKFVCSSGGNAGAAVAYAARRLGAAAVIVVPRSTPAFMVRRLRALGADVRVVGGVWDEADAHARTLLTPDAEYVPPFDDARLWDGLASLPRELHADLCGVPPAAVAVAVGGGGLFCGVALGCARVGWDGVPIIAAETAGAASFAAMVRARRPVALRSISSLAKSLGALQVADQCADWVVKRGRATRSVVVSDREAVEACSLLATHHRILVEPACGAAVAAALKTEATAGLGDGPIVVVVCGGNMASAELLQSWLETTNATPAPL